MTVLIFRFSILVLDNQFAVIEPPMIESASEQRAIPAMSLRSQM
jgi:hypothetical protein